MRLRADQGTFLLYSGATYMNFNRDCGAIWRRPLAAPPRVDWSRAPSLT